MNATKVASKKNPKTLLNTTFVQSLCSHFNCIITVEAGKITDMSFVLRKKK